jgi:hypothetical protein
MRIWITCSLAPRRVCSNDWRMDIAYLGERVTDATVILRKLITLRDCVAAARAIARHSACWAAIRQARQSAR